MPRRDPERSRRERDDADALNELVFQVVEGVVSQHRSPFSWGAEGKPTAAHLLGRRFRDRFEECERATTSVLDEMLMAALGALVGAEKTVSNEDLLKHGFDPWATPPKPDDF